LVAVLVRYQDIVYTWWLLGIIFGGPPFVCCCFCVSLCCCCVNAVRMNSRVKQMEEAKTLETFLIEDCKNVSLGISLGVRCSHVDTVMESYRDSEGNTKIRTKRVTRVSHKNSWTVPITGGQSIVCFAFMDRKGTTPKPFILTTVRLHAVVGDTHTANDLRRFYKMMYDDGSNHIDDSVHSWFTPKCTIASSKSPILRNQQVPYEKAAVEADFKAYMRSCLYGGNAKKAKEFTNKYFESRTIHVFYRFTTAPHGQVSREPLAQGESVLLSSSTTGGRKNSKLLGTPKRIIVTQNGQVGQH